MQDKLMVFRVVSSVFIRRIVRLSTNVATLLFVALVVGTWALAHYFSGLWWLLLVPILGFTIIFVVVRAIVLFINRRIYNQPLTKEQNTVVNAFVDKLNSLIEARTISRSLIIFISVKDLIRYGELRTIKQIIDDSVSLKSDFSNVERSLRQNRIVIDQDS